MLEQTLVPERTERTHVQTATIMSVATELPADRLTSRELAESLGISEDWIISRTGIHERRRARPDERLTDYAIRAGARALRAAGVAAEDVDLVIVATMSQDELTPNAAPLVAHALGADRAGAFDVGAACTAFLSGLAVGTAQIESGRAELRAVGRGRLHHPDHRLHRPAHRAAVRGCGRCRGARPRRRRSRCDRTARARGRRLGGTAAVREPRRASDPHGRHRGIPPRGRPHG